ncbi:MAG: helix-turn-helix domain-containing protein [Synergistaceae bacterium]|nr:helix-turn-helix domain-containing protein [Synergistaceae bacterium]MBQ6737487.1 helix-turn-helix domain-containing protein [Synergistaceae bacterium]MBQ7068526.1 helix-turn-helix domain-containing protein [Synergistaceae bacterium]MBR0080058.1 helix-turn-helix domain-containing protein [Synergistaceae bacterium]MBR0234750.1 helix-turn-helix domain-containing protein [Synergistaceae bacterium]
MYKAVVIRLFPTKSQAKLLWQNIGIARWTWNWGLEENVRHRFALVLKKFESIIRIVFILKKSAG